MFLLKLITSHRKCVNSQFDGMTNENEQQISLSIVGNLSTLKFYDSTDMIIKFMEFIQLDVSQQI